MSKRCRRCGRTLPVDGFYTNKSRRDGLTSYCKPCHTASNLESRARTRKQTPRRPRTTRRSGNNAWRTYRDSSPYTGDPAIDAVIHRYIHAPWGTYPTDQQEEEQ